MKVWSLFALIGVSVSAVSSAYPYTLDPAHAEEIMASLAQRPRLMDSQWLDIVGTRRDEAYTVVAGDNLWTIAGKLFNRPYLWRKLWEENPNITNPHTLNVGDTIVYYKPDIMRGVASTAAAPAFQIPVIKLSPNLTGKEFTLDSNSFVQRDYRNRSRPKLMVLAPEDPMIIGEITGAYSVGDSVNPLAPLYFSLSEGKSVKAGELYTVVHEEREIKDSTNPRTPTLGVLVTVKGTIEIVEKGERFWKADIKEMFGHISRGDEVIPLQSPVRWTSAIEPPNKLQARVLAGEEIETRLFGQGQIILLNKGRNAGMKEGYMFRVWRGQDPENQKSDGVEPSSKGDLRVLFAGETTSVAYILRDLEPIEIGDTAVPGQVFTDPPAPPQKDFSTLEID